jgi:hypothetical protein
MGDLWGIDRIGEQRYHRLARLHEKQKWDLAEAFLEADSSID